MQRGFSLLEAIFAMIITLITALAVVGSIIASRYALELDKQKLAAFNYVRQFIEAAETGNSIPPQSDQRLIPFNAPGVEDLGSRAFCEFFRLNNDNTVNWTPITPNPGELVLCRVRVRWEPQGTSREQTVSLMTLVRTGSL